MEKAGYVYILSNWTGWVLYTGVTRDLKQRVFEHKRKLREGFTTKYNVNKLVYYEICPDISTAIFREKQLKAGSRRKKVEAIQSINPDWTDLYDEI